MSCSGHPLFVPSKVLFFDASLTGCGAFVQGSSLVSHRHRSTEESQKSSSWRELAAIKFALAAFEAHLSGLRVRCNTDNQNVVRIIQFGSMVKELQDIALDFFSFHLSQANSASYELDTARSKLSGRFFQQDS